MSIYPVERFELLAPGALIVIVTIIILTYSYHFSADCRRLESKQTLYQIKFRSV
ncbi:hypothetical protein LINPERPRIM_LOCUS39800 [Linum perenne]